MSDVASRDLLQPSRRAQGWLERLGRWAARHPRFFLRIGEALGLLLLRFGHERRNIAARNLALCFPQLDEAAQAALLQRHFRLLGRALLDRLWLWHAEPAQWRELVRWDEASASRVQAWLGQTLAGLGQTQASGQPTLFLCPHFLGMDAAWMMLCQVLPPGTLVGYYRPPKQVLMDRWFYHARQRWGAPLVLRRQDGMRGLLRAMRDGRHGFLLPDQDLGLSGCAFVPFFGIEASTVTSVPRMAALAGAQVRWIVATVNDNAPGYVLRLSEALPGFPTDDQHADLKRLNQDIEACVREQPAQYYWTHRRFKTRPAGEPDLYA